MLSRRPPPSALGLGLALARAAAVLLTSELARAADSNEFAAALAKGPVYAGLAAFASGFLVSLTPCVYPMVAVTVSVFGAKQTESRLQGALLSAAFVLGIVAMFVPLGVAAGMTGSMAGAVLQSTWVVVGISVLFLVMAAAMFGAFELDLPSGLKNRLAQIGGAGYAGAFVLGIACGPIAAPCTGPFLTGILTWIAQTKSAGLGAAAMAAFALGLGVPFFLVGTFAVQLPKSGAWMVHVKSVLGIILVVVACYYLDSIFGVVSRVASPSRSFLAISGAIAVVGLAVGAVHKSFDGPLSDRFRKSFGLLLTTGAATAFVVGAVKPAAALEWHKADPRVLLEQAKASGRPMLVDFTASWCGACKELDKLTFATEPVRREAGRFLAVKVDATDDEDPKVAAILKEYRVLGLPTVVLFDSHGKEAARYTDFVAPEPFLATLRRVD